MTAEPVKSKVTPLVNCTPVKPRAVLPVFRSSMNSKSSATKAGLTANSPGVGAVGLYMTSVIRRLSVNAPRGSPAANWTGADQWLQRPALSCTRTRTR